MTYPLEGLLRPPVEWYSTLAAALLTGLLVCHPALFHSTLSYAKPIVIGLLIAFGCLRFCQGYRIWRYQHRLRHLPPRFLSNGIPMKSEHWFLGYGFAWLPIHTQRLRDLNLPQHQKYSCPHRLHSVCESETALWLPLSERASHVLVLGLPGMGKTRLAELLITQDIIRGDVVIVLDPKGDAELLQRMRQEAQQCGRGTDFRVLHLGFPEVSCRYNPIGHFTRTTEVANRIANQLPSSGDSAAFKAFGWQFINTITLTLLALSETPHYRIIQYYLQHWDQLLERYLEHRLEQELDFEALQSWLSDYQTQHATDKRPVPRLKALIACMQAHTHQSDPDPIFDSLHQIHQYPKDYFSKITASLNPLLKKLTTGAVSSLLSPDETDTSDPRPILEWLSVIRDKQIVYIGLDALSDREVASAVGNAIFADLVAVAGRLYKFGITGESERQAEPRQAEDLNLPRVCIHADEFNDIIGDEFVPLLNKGRGAGFTVTAYTQTWSDVEVRLQTAAKAGQVAGNFGTVILFRCKESRTVDMLLEQLPVVPILTVIPASSANDSAHNQSGDWYRSSNEDRLSQSEQPLLAQNDVLHLPLGQAFLRRSGHLYKLRVPLSL